MADSAGCEASVCLLGQQTPHIHPSPVLGPLMALDPESLGVEIDPTCLVVYGDPRQRRQQWKQWHSRWQGWLDSWEDWFDCQQQNQQPLPPPPRRSNNVQQNQNQQQQQPPPPPPRRKDQPQSLTPAEEQLEQQQQPAPDAEPKPENGEEDAMQQLLHEQRLWMEQQQQLDQEEEADALEQHPVSPSYVSEAESGLISMGILIRVFSAGPLQLPPLEDTPLRPLPISV